MLLKFQCIFLKAVFGDFNINRHEEHILGLNICFFHQRKSHIILLSFNVINNIVFLFRFKDF
jgi:hypothetical protein